MPKFWNAKMIKQNIIILLLLWICSPALLNCERGCPANADFNYEKPWNSEVLSFYDSKVFY